MIIEFTFGNFRSFQTVQTFSMVAANISSKNKDLDTNNIFETIKQQKLLRSKAIYGANASGKSNIIKALSAFVQIVKKSVKDENIIKAHVKPFRLHIKSEQEPIFFQLIFIHKAVKYRYGFEIQDNRVFSEWLFAAPKGREVAYFTREGESVSVENAFKVAKHFEANYKTPNEIFTSTALFLSSLSAMGNEIAKEVTEAIDKIAIISSSNDPMLRANLLTEIDEQQTKANILEFVNAADIDLKDIKVQPTDISKFPAEMQEFIVKIQELEENKLNMVEIATMREQYDDNKKVVKTIECDYDDWESEGTKKIATLSPILIDVLANSRVLAIDEFDSRLHPNLTHKIVSLFNSPQTNPHNAQLIFVTHDTTLLKPDKLRRDQICFVEKDRYGSSTILDLVEFKGVRNDASYDKEYLQGTYGAIPFLSNIDALFTQN
jgi:AAA15 family ATPase/GTPase